MENLWQVAWLGGVAVLSLLAALGLGWAGLRSLLRALG